MKFLAIAGTAAMFLVGGGILSHNISALHHWSEALTQRASSWLGTTSESMGSAAIANGAAGSWIEKAIPMLAPLLFDAVIGMVAGAAILAVVTLATRVFRRAR